MVSGKSYSTDHTMGFVNVMRSDSIEISKSFDSIAFKLLVCFMGRDKPHWLSGKVATQRPVLYGLPDTT